MTGDLANPEALLSGLLHLLEVKEIGTDLFRGRRLRGGRGRVFGGQVIAQALMAATRSVPAERSAHSLHAYFMRPGSEDLPIDYLVERDFDGRSFATRRVIAQQAGKPILSMTASFHRSEPGFEHQADMPDVPPPEDFADEREYWIENAHRLPEPMQSHVLRRRPIEIRPVGVFSPLDPSQTPPVSRSWFRAVAPVDAGPHLHRAIFAYMSDMRLMGTAMLPHGVSWFTGRVRGASLDHALWIHEDFRVDDWLLFAADSPWAGNGRGFNRGLIFTRDGRLVASVAQEGLMRERRPLHEQQGGRFAPLASSNIKASREPWQRP